MLKNNIIALVLLMFLATNAQNIDLPSDIRQHNITNFNTSLLNPAYSLNTNTSQSIGLWTRWQWQTVDADPTSLFLNYNRKIGETSSVGVGFLQNNTGVFINTGGVVNYAHTFDLGSNVFLGVGVNVMGYTQELADTRFQVDPQIQLPQLANSNNFILQVAPGLNLKMNRFSIGVVAENLYDYNFTNKERSSVSGDRVFLGLASYEFPISIFGFNENTFVRPVVYYKTVPNQDSQFGVTTILNTSKFWVQAGYNDFYGVSGGIGGNFFKRLSIGALVEFGTSSDLKGVNVDPTFELVTTYNFGKQKVRKEKTKEEEDVEKEEKLAKQLSKSEALAAKKTEKHKVELKKLKAKHQRDSLLMVKKEETLLMANKKEERQRVKDSTRASKRQQKLLEEKNRLNETKIASAEAVRIKKKDSIDRAKLEEALAFSRRLREKRKKDSVAKKELALGIINKEANIKANKEVVVVQKGEKYEEVTKEGNLEPGYYLIANVFGTKKYLELFMKDMKKKGLNPAYFYRSKNRFSYVYLGKYKTISEARAARDSKLNGKYTSKTWIFRVTGE
ncbi:PorP/SprF family type IX secretion system membrane protein [uncultured Maribacter sp.]|uniref:PorP/SprF family type IX secretion system membrane protein n=1 Tax=uncultured Maribacter sp. TaxID=431308 RepID=UPI00263214E3|nr:PorP/SprF family type IX secretion system membrane protein [uncultured Maribacter sp.]